MSLLVKGVRVNSNTLLMTKKERRRQFVNTIVWDAVKLTAFYLLASVLMWVYALTGVKEPMAWAVLSIVAVHVVLRKH